MYTRFRMGGETLSRAVFAAVEPIKKDMRTILSRLDEIVHRLDDLTERMKRIEVAVKA